MNKPVTRLNPRTEWFLLLGAIALGSFLRLYRLESLPPGDGHDVAQYGVDALHILDGARPIFFETNFGREALFSYLVAFIFRFTGPTTFGIHLTSAIVGILTIPAIYLATRELFHEEREGLLAYLPLFAAFLAAVSYWHLNWSRVGLRVILVPLFAALVTFALWRGFRTNRKLWFAISGGLAGLSLYTYQSARLLPVLVAIAFAVQGLLSRRWTRSDTFQLLITTGFLLLVFAPLAVYAGGHPGALSERIRQAAIVDPEQPLQEQAQTILSHATTALLTYSVRGDTDPQFTIAGRPSLNPFLSAGLLVGILFAIGRFQRSPYLYLLAWLAIMTAPALIADQAAMAKRYLGAFPAVMVLAAFGFLVPLQWWNNRATGHTKRAGITIYKSLLAAGLIYTTFVTWRDYFVVWAADPDLPAHFQVDHREIGQAISRLDPQQSIWLSPFVADHPVIQFHAGLRPDLRGYNGRFCTPYSDPVGESGITYFIVPGFQDNSLDQLESMFPEGETTSGPLRPSSDQPYYRTFQIPPGATSGESTDPIVSWTEGLTLVDYSVSAQDAAPGDSISITLTYRADKDISADYTAFVHLLGLPHPESGSPLWAQTDSVPCSGTLPTGRWRAGDYIRDTIILQLPVDIPEGEYKIVTGFYTWPALVRLTTTQTNSDSFSLGALRVKAR